MKVRLKMNTLNKLETTGVFGGVADHPDQPLADWISDTIETIRSFF
jgi:hypothetical protein